MWGENRKIKVILFRWETIFLTYFFKIENKLYIKFKNKKQIIYLFCLKMSPVLLILYKQKSNIKNYLEGNSDREINTFFFKCPPCVWDLKQVQWMTEGCVECLRQQHKECTEGQPALPENVLCFYFHDYV